MNVEVIKIGEVIGRLSGEGALKPYVLIACDGDDTTMYYVNLFLNEMRQELEDNGVKIQKTSSSIMNNTFDRYNGKWVASPNDSSSIKISGVQTSDIVVGQSYELDNNWHTSRIERIIDNCIIITKNSIYAIHNLQQLRERKIKDLGI